KSIEEFISAAPEYPLDRLKLECKNSQKARAMKLIAERYQDAYKEVNSVSTVDGVRLEMENGWALIRPSGTEPLLRITVEGRTMADVEDIMDRGRVLVKKVLGLL
ncbi:phosphoglucosamine mutase, partial [Candidatus Bathyarchaeota archaeon]|nr:phosphoglucosamine mutase [Candidatus Bathyarchaeota archaeon]